jgi:MoaA/NifB/PqqE/SkfB family radical SAM enzyme
MHCLDSVGNIKENTIQEVIHGPVLSDLREHMAQGRWHKACGWCKQLEETTGTSGRTTRHASKETIEHINNDISWFTLEHIVVNWSNLCNLTCVYCNAETSTAWQSIKGIPINHVKNEHKDLIELAQVHGHTVQGLMLGGGEPLLQKGLLDFLRCLNSEQVRVLVTTNLSVDITSNPIYQELRHWSNVDWQISFDNTDKSKFEYVRDGAVWETFVNNIRRMKQDGQHVVAHPAYSIYCAFDLVDYYDFCTSEGLDLFWCELTHPWDLDIRRYPETLRQLAIAEIEQVLEKYPTGAAVETLARYRMTLLDPSYVISPDYCPNPQKFHSKIEAELKKTITFQQLWPIYDR